MARIALDQLEFAAERRRGQALFRIYNANEKEHGYSSSFTFIEMVNDDMPFLVDSAAAAISRQNLVAHITVHPIISVNRDKSGNLTAVTKPDDPDAHSESFIRFAITHTTDEKVIRSLQKVLVKVLSDVRVAVRDWGKMRQRMRETRDLIENGPKGVDPLLRTETQALLDWMVEEHFTFLGYREYKLSKRGKRTFLNPVKGSGLGILSKTSSTAKPIELTTEMERLARSRDWLILTKANSRSTVHRSAFLDYVGVKIYDKDGNAVGERRFIGLLTSIAYSESPRNIPLLRHKVSKIFERAHVEQAGHRGKALLHIIETYPREELFQSSIQDLTRTAVGILNLQDRRRVRMFLRRDAFRRFFSCLVFVPREKYTTAIRRNIETLLVDAFDGISVDSAVQISESALARVHIIVRTPNGKRPRISINKLEQHLVELLVTWSDRLSEELRKSFGVDRGDELFSAYGNIFPAGYQADTAPKEACGDIRSIDEMLRNGVNRSVDLYSADKVEPGDLRFIVYSLHEPIALSAALPILEEMGAAVYTERPYEATLKSGESFWMQDFHLRHESGASVDVKAVSDRFEECFMAVLDGEAENDGLNRLIVSAELDWRQVTLLRCYAKHILQLGVPFSQSYMEDVLVAHAHLAHLLVRQFELQFDPDIAKSRRKRELKEIRAKVQRGLSRASNVDEDRILNAHLPAASTQRCAPITSRQSTATEELYLDQTRPGATSGSAPAEAQVRDLRLFAGSRRRASAWRRHRTWRAALVRSARRFSHRGPRPDESPGGQEHRHRADRRQRRVLPKRCPRRYREGDPQERRALLQDVYSRPARYHRQCRRREVVTPEGVVRRDGDDPYLVVAADKGTATFSDIANGMSAEYGLLAGRCLCIRGLSRLRPQEDGHYGARRLGGGQAPLP